MGCIYKDLQYKGDISAHILQLYFAASTISWLAGFADWQQHVHWSNFGLSFNTYKKTKNKTQTLFNCIPLSDRNIQWLPKTLKRHCHVNGHLKKKTLKDLTLLTKNVLTNTETVNNWILWIFLRGENNTECLLSPLCCLSESQAFKRAHAVQSCSQASLSLWSLTLTNCQLGCSCIQR